MQQVARLQWTFLGLSIPGWTLLVFIALTRTRDLLRVLLRLQLLVLRFDFASLTTVIFSPYCLWWHRLVLLRGGLEQTDTTSTFGCQILFTTSHNSYFSSCQRFRPLFDTLSTSCHQRRLNHIHHWISLLLIDSTLSFPFRLPIVSTRPTVRTRREQPYLLETVFSLPRKLPELCDVIPRH